ncbi:MAG: hypothetical protein HYW47_01040 [Deltaproteobacteria bacterium]|nr:hypothetical protein [Deltaproteobacteria bacterium]
MNDFWFSVASAPVGILFHAKGIAILGRAARALKGARRFNDARHVLHAKGLLSQSKKLWKLNPKKAQSLLEEAKIILGKIGAQDPDVQLAQSLLGEVEEVGIRMTRGRQLEKAYKPLRKFAHDHLVDEGVQLSRLSGGELKAARLQAIGRMTRLMKAAGVAVDNPQSLENFGQVLKQNPQFRTHATKIFKAYGNDDTLLKETISEVGGFSEWAPMAANLAEHFEDPNDIKKFFDQVIGALKPQVSKIGTPIGFSPEQYDDFLRQLKDPHSPLFQNFKSTISCS